jgi:hypothetical protein
MSYINRRRGHCTALIASSNTFAAVFLNSQVSVIKIFTCDHNERWIIWLISYLNCLRCPELRTRTHAAAVLRLPNSHIFAQLANEVVRPDCAVLPNLYSSFNIARIYFLEMHFNSVGIVSFLSRSSKFWAYETFYNSTACFHFCLTVLPVHPDFFLVNFKNTRSVSDSVHKMTQNICYAIRFQLRLEVLRNFALVWRG